LPDPHDRVQKLVAGRRAGTVSLRQFEAQIECFSNQELGRLAALLLETTPARRKRLEHALLRYCEQTGGLFAT